MKVVAEHHNHSLSEKRINENMQHRTFSFFFSQSQFLVIINSIVIHTYIGVDKYFKNKVSNIKKVYIPHLNFLGLLWYGE